MQKKNKRFRYWGVLLFLMLFAAGFTAQTTAKEVQATTVKNGFVKENGKTYYYQNGVKYKKGFLKLKGNYYYFTTTTGQMMEGWAKNKKGEYRYFYNGTGIMATQWVKNSKGDMRYFAKKSGKMLTGWLTNSKGQMRYFYNGTGFMATGWLKNSKGDMRYFYNGSGVMATGWLQNSKGERRFFDTDDGKMKKGWVKNSNTGETFYFNEKSGIAATGTLEMDGFKYVFSSKGVLQSSELINSSGGSITPTSKRSLKNFLASALLPVGNTLYVWGGGHNNVDPVRKGVSPKWIQFYNTQSSDYDYNNTRFQTEMGLDCSGFVGWAVYQAMGQYSTDVSGNLGSLYSGRGWGETFNQSYLSSKEYKLYPGDIAYNGGHTWIVLGQCYDGSVVLVHSTPDAGVQISGTTTPEGGYNSRAINLAQSYMQRYKGFTKYDYHTSVGNYIKQYNYFRWNSSTLPDPDGYRNKTADQILANLFSQRTQ